MRMQRLRRLPGGSTLMFCGPPGPPPHVYPVVKYDISPTFQRDGLLLASVHRLVISYSNSATVADVERSVATILCGPGCQPTSSMTSFGADSSSRANER